MGAHSQISPLKTGNNSEENTRTDESTRRRASTTEPSRSQTSGGARIACLFPRKCKAMMRCSPMQQRKRRPLLRFGRVVVVPFLPLSPPGRGRQQQCSSTRPAGRPSVPPRDTAGKVSHGARTILVGMQSSHLPCPPVRARHCSTARVVVLGTRLPSFRRANRVAFRFGSLLNWIRMLPCECACACVVSLLFFRGVFFCVCCCCCFALRSVG